MKAIVHGISITLTKEQEEYVKKEMASLKADYNGWEKALKLAGFKKSADQAWVNEDRNWFADLYKRGRQYTLWATGKGLKDIGSFPGGWEYGDPQDFLKTALK